MANRTLIVTDCMNGEVVIEFSVERGIDSKYWRMVFDKNLNMLLDYNRDDVYMKKRKSTCYDKVVNLDNGVFHIFYRERKIRKNEIIIIPGSLSLNVVEYVRNANGFLSGYSLDYTLSFDRETHKYIPDSRYEHLKINYEYHKPSRTKSAMKTWW